MYQNSTEARYGTLLTLLMNILVAHHSAGKHDRCFYTHALARFPLKYTIENLTSWSEGDTTLKNTSVYYIKQ